MSDAGNGQPKYLWLLISRSLKAWGQWRGLVAAVVAFGGAWLFGELSITTARAITAAFLVWLGALLTFFTPKKMWEESVRRIADLEDQLRPKLELVFGGDSRPYLQVVEYIMGNPGVTFTSNPFWMERRYRLGVRNRSSVVVDAELILENCEPRAPNVFPDHALLVMGERDSTKRVTIPPSGVERRPSRYFDVVYEQWRHDAHRGGVFLAYYQDVPNQLPNGRYTLTLRLDGGPSPVRVQLLVKKDSDEDDLRVSLVIPMIFESR